MTRKLLLTVFSLAFFCAASAPVFAQTHSARIAGQAAVRIVPTALGSDETSTNIGGGRWELHGYDLRSILARAEGTDPGRIDLDSPALAGRRYDISIALAGGESEAEIARALRAAIERQFGLRVSQERRMEPVMVMTAPNGGGSGLHAHISVAFAPEEFSYEEQICPEVRKVGITAKAASIHSFSRTLSREFGETYVDETGLKGSYDFKIPERASREAFFRAMQEQLGLVFTRSERAVDVLVVRPAEQHPRPQAPGLEVAAVQ